jgi:hypothetical protein
MMHITIFKDIEEVVTGENIYFYDKFKHMPTMPSENLNIINVVENISN